MTMMYITILEKNNLNFVSHFDVGIPTLVIVERATGKLITDNGRGAIQKDPAGEVRSNACCMW